MSPAKMEDGAERATPSSVRAATPLPGQTELSVRLLQDPNKGSASPLTNELLIAARKGYSKEIERILLEKVSTASTTVDRQGRNCLHLACHNGHLQTVSVILKMELLDINCTSKRGFTPLHEASAEGHIQVVLLLLSMGAFYKARSKEGWTALMSTCYNGHYEIARMLLAIGLDVNAINTYGFTALHVAAWKGNISIIELLIKEGAIITMETHNGKTALDVAKEERQHEAMIVLQSASVRESEKPFFRIAALESQLRMLQDKLKKVHEEHEKVLSQVREKASQELDEVKQQLLKELTESRKEIGETLKCTKGGTTVTANGFLPHQGDIVTTKSTPDIQVSEHSPPQAATKKKKKNIEAKSHRGSVGEISIKQSPLLLSHERTETVDDLQYKPTLGLPFSDDTIPRRSLDSVRLAPRATTDKLTITQMVEDNLYKAGSMTAIRQQIKADGLTPKINRKFNRPLPSMPEESSLPKPVSILEGDDN